MNIRHLKIYYDTANTMSMRKAATMNNISQPMVSKVISQFEKEYKIKCFDRNGRHVSITEDGKALLAAIEPIVLNLQLLNGFSPEERVIGIGVIPSIAEQYLVILMNAMKRLLPNYKFFFKVKSAVNLKADFLNNDLDFVVTDSKILSTGVSNEVILSDETVLMAPKSYNLAPEISIHDLQGINLFVKETSTQNNIQTGVALEEAGVEPNVIGEVASNPLLGTVVSAGLGTAFVSKKSYLNIPVENTTISSIKDCDFSRPWYIAFHSFYANNEIYRQITGTIQDLLNMPVH